MKFRHEYKHCINMSDYYMITSKLKHIAKLDTNAGSGGEYRIRSLYFDNYNDKILNEKVLGINNRDKFRIRYYNDEINFIKLEKKSKINGLCLKLSASITAEECEKILAGDIDFLRQSPKGLFNELYVKMKDQLLRPRTIVDYTREAYIYKPGNVRITFDKKIRTGIKATDFLNQDVVTTGIIDNSMMVLEVKFDEFLPEVIQDCIQTNTRRAQSVSKYALCRMYG